MPFAIRRGAGQHTDIHMLRKLKSLTVALVAGASVVTVALMLLVGMSGAINPENHPLMCNIGLVFPVFIVANILFLAFWLVFKWRMALIPLVGFLLGYGAVRSYAPLNMGTQTPKGAVKVLSYNVHMFSHLAQGREGAEPVMRYIKDSNADIVCLQEAMLDGMKTEMIGQMLGREYPHRDTVRKSNSHNCLVLLSKYPIKGRYRFDYQSDGNLSAAWQIDIGGQRVTVVNNHFESNKLTDEDKQGFKDMVKGEMRDSAARHENATLIQKLGEAALKRAAQVNAVAAYVDSLRGQSVIVCGDFNDSPISYTCHTLEQRLTNCYVATATGPGFSYCQGAIRVRIDNVLCSADWQPHNFTVDSKTHLSDHYPIYGWLKKRH